MLKTVKLFSSESEDDLNDERSNSDEINPSNSGQSSSTQEEYDEEIIIIIGDEDGHSNNENEDFSENII